MTIFFIGVKKAVVENISKWNSFFVLKEGTKVWHIKNSVVSLVTSHTVRSAIMVEPAACTAHAAYATFAVIRVLVK